MVRSRGLSTSASLFAAMFASGHLLETLRRVAIKISQRDISAFRFRHVPLRKQVIDFWWPPGSRGVERIHRWILVLILVPHFSHIFQSILPLWPLSSAAPTAISFLFPSWKTQSYHEDTGTQGSKRKYRNMIPPNSLSWKYLTGTVTCLWSQHWEVRAGGVSGLGQPGIPS